MLTALRNRIRRYLGTDNPEETMASILTLLQGLAAQQTEASAAQLASFTNLQNALTRQSEAITRLEELVRSGEASPEVQALTEQLSAGLAEIKAAADSADDGFEPATEPVPPVEDEDPTVPVEGEPVADESTRRRR